MPFTLTPPEPWQSRGWKVKIFDREGGPEEPHVSIVFKGSPRRISLRTWQPLEGDPLDTPEGLLEFVRENGRVLRSAWDERYPHNPVSGRAKKGKNR